ncbi:MAG TPA: chromosome segregation protein SMC [Deltaproteobacteria bacterium]|nr:chromosome segregation protein SMC [Deltaproteobacteria bacterium]
MNLKKLEITGFKSFRDKSVLDFSGGITAIVGPNGCGKSNVVDAIRWVMGEQRVKILRGKKMDDVIFNGSQDTEGVGLAEVTMTLIANGHNFPGAYSGMNEISITRKVIREGESEYYINRVPCRLLDVREFFMGTGVGARTYSLVEQGNVMSLVEAKPEDRRLFIEDAAGVSKYKSRKDAAVRKMEATKQNILRLNDIIKEVKSQLNAITRQAKRAEQYKEIKTRFKETELALAMQNYGELFEKGSSLQAERDVLQQQEASLRANIEAKESQLEEIKTKILEQEELIGARQRAFYEAKNALSIKEKNIEFAGHQIADCDERKRKNIAEIQSLNDRKEQLSGEISDTRRRAAEAEQKIAALKTDLNEGLQKAGELSEADKETNSRLEENKIEYIDIVTEKAKLKNMISSLAKSIEDLKKREERETREIEEDKRKLADLTAALSSVNDALTASVRELNSLREKLEEFSGELERTKTELQLCEESYLQTKEEIGVKTSRLNSLKEFQESFKWESEGVREVIEKPEKHDKFYGVVADHISVPREYEMAVEAVLGEKLHYVVVKSPEDGVWAIDYLKNYHLGRGSFMPQEARNLNGKAGNQYPGKADPLMQKIEVKEDFRQVAECLLGDVFLIPSMESGISLWKQNGFRGTFVTREGDLITAHGVLSGGSNQAMEKGLLATKREITELDADVASLSARLEDQLKQKSDLSAALTRWEEEVAQIKTSIHSLEIEINSRKKDSERFTDAFEATKQRLAALEFNCRTIKEEAAEAIEKTSQISAEIAAKEDEEKKINAIISELNIRREQSRTAIDDQERSLTGKKIELAALEEKKDADSQTISRLEKDIAAIENEIKSKEEGIVSCEQQIAELAAGIEAEQANLKELYGNLEAQETELNEMKAGQSAQDEQLKSRENDIKETKKTLDELRQKINEKEILCREAALNAENLTRAIRDKYDVDWENMLSSFTKIDEEEINELTLRLEKDRQAVSNFGEVNLLAINEYEELDTRYQFLSEQVADLNASLNTLQRTITRINKISRTRFAETFAAINSCFKEVFAHIFPGGRGQLLLTDENDLLETGVDIDIQIPGKKAQSVSLLSGGEKSLAAVALIFAILMYRPSPFLVLDEVDAALDDANTNLFNNLIKDVAQKSQVVMITHNKTTMEVADTLFGVTMHKNGISSLVSVSLN